MNRRRTGYTLIEMVVAMAIFGIITFILLSLTKELAFWERRLQLDFLRHPQVIAVISRLRRDVEDAYGEKPYSVTVDGYKNGDPKILVLETLHESGGVRDIVWDFSQPGVVERRSYNVGSVTVWRARGLPPDFTAEILSEDNPNPNGAYGVHLKAVDAKGRVSIDETFFPRTTRKGALPPGFDPKAK